MLVFKRTRVFMMLEGRKREKPLASAAVIREAGKLLYIFTYFDVLQATWLLLQ